MYSGSFDCLKKIIRHEGLLALWSGSTARVVRLVPGQVRKMQSNITFYMYILHVLVYIHSLMCDVLITL